MAGESGRGAVMPICSGIGSEHPGKSDLHADRCIGAKAMRFLKRGRQRTRPWDGRSLFVVCRFLRVQIGFQVGEHFAGGRANSTRPRQCIEIPGMNGKMFSVVSLDEATLL